MGEQQYITALLIICLAVNINMSVLARTVEERFASRDRSIIGTPAKHWLGQANDTIFANTIICDTVRANTIESGTIMSNAATTMGSVDLTGAYLASSFKTSVTSDFPIITPAVVNAGIADERLECRILQSGLAYPVISAPGAFAIPDRGTIKFQFTPLYTMRITAILSTNTAGATGITIQHLPVGPSDPTRANLVVHFVPTVDPLMAPFAPKQGTEHDIEISWDRALSISRVFIDGVLLAQSSAAIPASADPLQPFVGQPFFMTGQGAFLMRNLVIIPRVIHTTSFTLVPYSVITSIARGMTEMTALRCADLMLCNSAPSQPTSVLRLQDLTSGWPSALSMTASGFWNPSGDSIAQTIRLQRVGNMVMAVAAQPTVLGTLTAISLLTYSIEVPAGWIAPVIANSMKIIVPLVVNGVAKNGLISIEYNPIAMAGVLTLSNSDQLNVSAGFGLGDTVVISSWSATWLSS